VESHASVDVNIFVAGFLFESLVEGSDALLVLSLFVKLHSFVV